MTYSLEWREQLVLTCSCLNFDFGILTLKVKRFLHLLFVKGVNAQDSGSSATELVALADNGIGVVARLPNGEGGEIRKKREY